MPFKHKSLPRFHGPKATEADVARVAESVTAALIDRLIGLDVHVAHMLMLARQLQESDNPRLKSFAGNLHRHARGVQVTSAAVKQELNQGAL